MKNPSSFVLSNHHLLMLKQISEIALSSVTPQEALAEIAEDVLGLAEGTTGIAILLREEDELVCMAVAGQKTPYAIGQRIPYNDHQLSAVFEGSTPMLFGGHAGSQGSVITVEEMTDTSGLPKLLYVPVRADEAVEGLLVVAATDGQPFGEKSISIFELAANWTAIVLRMALQRFEIQRQVVEHLTLRKIHSALGESVDLTPTLQLIADAAIEIIPRAEGAVIHLLDDKRAVLQPVAVAGRVGEMSSGLTFRPGIGVAGQVMATATVMNLGDVKGDARILAGQALNEMSSLLVAPVSSSDNSFGTISVQSSARHAFTATDERLMAALGVEAAIAIHNARLYQAERRQRHMAEGLAEAAFSFNRSLKLDQVLDRILDQIVRVVPCNAVSIMLIEEKMARIVRQRSNGPSGAQSTRSPAIELPLKLHSFRAMIETGEPFLIPDVDLDPDWKVMASSRWIRSYAAAPLITGNRTLGFLTVVSEQPDFFNEDTVSALKAFAAHAAIAIQNARLYQNLEYVLQEEKAIRAQLLQADKLAAMGRITSALAHEVNNPVQAIQGCLERAQAYYGDPEKQQYYLSMATEELTRLTGILKRVLDFQRPAEGERKNVEVGSLLSDVLALLEKRLQLAHVAVSYEPGPESCTIRAVSGQIKQVFLNLILNALDAMPDGGELTIGMHLTHEERKWLQIYFSDTGSGILPESLSHLFEPFFTTKAQGNGLGLWVSNIIITSHEGRLTAESIPNKGTTFTVWLPCRRLRSRARSRKE